jgi:hypothetical protein
MAKGFSGVGEQDAASGFPFVREGVLALVKLVIAG